LGYLRRDFDSQPHLKKLTKIIKTAKWGKSKKIIYKVGIGKFLLSFKCKYYCQKALTFSKGLLKLTCAHICSIGLAPKVA